MTRNPKTAVSLALLPPPEDVRVLRLVPALAYLNIVDATGGEPLLSYACARLPMPWIGCAGPILCATVARV